MNVRLLLNPASGRGRGGRARTSLERLAKRAGIAMEESSSAADLARRSREAALAGVERLLVAGGDGTWHWAAQGLAGTATALAPIPLGTGNDLARELGYPLDLAGAFAAGVEGPLTRIDLGRMGERWFCGVAGVGFDAAVAERARSRTRWLRGPLVYAWATLATLPFYRCPHAELETPFERFSGEVYFIAFANTSHYGGGMRVAPRADPTDGLLDIVVVRRCRRLELLRIFPRVYRGGHLGHPAVRVLRAPSVRVSLEPRQLLNLDGEGAGWTAEEPLQVELSAGALAVVGARSSHKM